MNLQQAMAQLEQYRALQRTTRQQIEYLRQVIKEAGGDPDKPKADLIKRNKKIYKRWKDANTFATVAREFNLSNTTIASICNRIERSLETKKGWYKLYKDLIKYK